MEILQRTQGIDPKAKSGALIGRAEVILKDADTGRIKEIVRQKNMLTNGLDSLYNGCPYGLDSNMIIGGDNPYSPREAQVPVVSTGLGGILVFPQALGNSADLLFPDFDSNYPTGYASVASYTQEDSRQGAYDAVSSGPITNGFRHVYNWGSAFGNGPIASIALSHKNCYKYFNDLSVSTIRQAQYMKNLVVSTINGYMNIIGANSKGIFLNGGMGGYGAFPTGAKIWRWNKGRTKMDLLFDSYNAPTSLDPIWEYPAYGFFCVEENYIYFVHVTSTSASSSTFDFYTIDLSDNTSSKITLTISANLLRDGGYRNDTFSKRGNYIYLYKADQQSMYKINITNAADITEIELPSGLSDPYEYGTSTIKGTIYGKGFIIGTDDIARASTAINTKIFDADGVWAVFGIGSVGAAIIAPYAATHADLQSTVNKDATKQMIIQYSITQV